MSLVFPDITRAPTLQIELPASKEAATVVLKNATVGKQLAINLPKEWGGDDLYLDFYRRTITDQAGTDRSALLDPKDNELWGPEPLVAGGNAVTIEVKGDAGSKFSPEWLTAPPPNSTGLAVGANYIYWGHEWIGRAKLDGSEPNNEWFSASFNPRYIAVDATYLYWAENSLSWIGRAKLDGSEPKTEWLTAPTNTHAVAVDANYVYWSDSTLGTIGRAKLDGSEPKTEWLTAPGVAEGLAVDATYIYWAEFSGGVQAIGRAKLDGSEPNNEWIAAPTGPLDVAVDANYVYWSDVSGTIGRANIDGSEPNNKWIAKSAGNVVVDSYFFYWLDAGSNVGRTYAARAILRWNKGHY